MYTKPFFVDTKLSAWALCYGFVSKSTDCQNLEYSMWLIFLHNYLHYFFRFALYEVWDGPDGSCEDCEGHVAVRSNRRRKRRSTSTGVGAASSSKLIFWCPSEGPRLGSFLVSQWCLTADSQGKSHTLRSHLHRLLLHWQYLNRGVRLRKMIMAISQETLAHSS